MTKTPDINSILKRPEFHACSIRGAEMGRCNRLPDGIKPGKVYVQRLRLTDGACYDSGYAYWGSPETVWCGFTADLSTMVFVRAENRGEARIEVLETLSAPVLSV